jgi:hypothetical protein
LTLKESYAIIKSDLRGGETMKEKFKNNLEESLKKIQNDFAKIYQNDSNEGLSIYMDKNGYITAFSMDAEGIRIPELNILITGEEE